MRVKTENIFFWPLMIFTCFQDLYGFSISEKHIIATLERVDFSIVFAFENDLTLIR